MLHLYDVENDYFLAIFVRVLVSPFLFSASRVESILDNRASRAFFSAVSAASAVWTLEVLIVDLKVSMHSPSLALPLALPLALSLALPLALSLALSLALPLALSLALNCSGFSFRAVARPVAGALSTRDEIGGRPLLGTIASLMVFG